MFITREAKSREFLKSELGQQQQQSVQNQSWESNLKSVLNMRGHF